ncbi:hypothetical protein ATKI12_4385 [Kitasatospora sp. Ki12]
MVLVVYTPVNPNVRIRTPAAPPTPPVPGHPPLAPAELATFRQWKSGLTTGGYFGGTEADKPCQWDALPAIPSIDCPSCR